MKQTNSKKGFTLVELLVVIGTLSIIATLVVVTFNSSRARARDTQRVNNIKEIQSALELYYNRHQAYPTAITPGQALIVNGTTYIDPVPSNPTPRTDGECPNNEYRYESFGTSYQLTFCLGESTGALTRGTAICSEGGCGSCGSYTVKDYEGNTYTTVQVGTQCWLGQNLKTKYKPDGTCINGYATPCPDASSNDNSLGRACYSNNESNCTAYGALYTLAGVMNGSTTPGTRGICPAGWHVPTDAEFTTLRQYLWDPSVGPTYTCDNAVAWNCLPSGTKVKAGGSSGMNDPLAGYRSNDGSTFTLFGNTGLWVSSTPGLTNSTLFRLNSAQAGSLRQSWPGTYSFSLRCLKNH